MQYSEEYTVDFFPSRRFAIAPRLFRFRLRSPNCRLSYTRHVIPSPFLFSFCSKVGEARNTDCSSVRKGRVARARNDPRSTYVKYCAKFLAKLFASVSPTMSHHRARNRLISRVVRRLFLQQARVIATLCQLCMSRYIYSADFRARLCKLLDGAEVKIKSEKCIIVLISRERVS